MTSLFYIIRDWMAPFQKEGAGVKNAPPAHF
jgi:hypothetical protein